jgi:predicted CopG family antitoxin
MSRRTTILLDDDIYERLVNESMRRYRTTKAMSKVANELLKRALKGEAKVLDLVFSEKLAKTNVREFETFRRELSKRFEY